jgi:hypothetical protein
MRVTLVVQNNPVVLLRERLGENNALLEQIIIGRLHVFVENLVETFGCCARR